MGVRLHRFGRVWVEMARWMDGERKEKRKGKKGQNQMLQGLGHGSEIDGGSLV
jgi:hypothetical protein